MNKNSLESEEIGVSQEIRNLGIIILVTAVISTLGVMGYAYLSQPPAKIGVINIDSEIYSFNYTRQIEDAMNDNSIKAVVVRFNSPGGSVNASFQTEASLSNLAEEKPVVANLEEYASSGAYLVASASDYIYAHEQTITAGLGVIAVWVSYEDYYENKGIDYFVWKSGGQKDWFAPWRKPTDKENSEIDNLVQGYASDLFNKIIQNRHPHEPENKSEFENLISELQDGSTIYGAEALYYGLIDNLGGYHDAVDRVASMAGLREGEYRVVELS
ncbi:MAG: S49 family peptidase [Hadesarchaea archaeon]|nr:S49 family peptidase [Hadesarchaea archaeon]